MGKPVFGVSHKVISKPACLTTETSLKVELKLVSSLGSIITKVLDKVLRLSFGNLVHDYQVASSIHDRFDK